MEFGAAFIIGLLGSLHCVGMCGPIVMALPLTVNEKSKVIFQSFVYHVGRITTYALMGLIMGLLGWGVLLTGYQHIFSILLGSLLVLMALFSISIEQQLFSIPVYQQSFNWVKSKLSKALSIKGSASAFKIGLLNGILPCGLVYVALAGAIASGHILSGALYMACFGLGTLPMMLGVMVFGHLNKSRFFRFRKLIPVGLVLFGAFLIYRGAVVGVPVDPGVILDSGFKMKCH